MRLLRATGVRILIIDEVHNLLSGAAGQQRRFLNLLRWLGNELQIPLVPRSAPPRRCAQSRVTTRWRTGSARSHCRCGAMGTNICGC